MESFVAVRPVFRSAGVERFSRRENPTIAALGSTGFLGEETLPEGFEPSILSRVYLPYLVALRRFSKRWGEFLELELF